MLESPKIGIESIALIVPDFLSTNPAIIADRIQKRQGT
jgi:hypothetical protein